MDLLDKLSCLDIPLTLNDLNKPEPVMVQRIYKTILIKCFGFPEMTLSQTQFTWVTPEMQRDAELYNRAEGCLVLTRFIQCILNDYTNMADDSPMFGVGALVDPKPRETKQYLSQLITIARLKQTARPYYEQEEARFQAQIAQNNQLEEKAARLEQRLEQLKSERAARLRREDQLCRGKEERATVLTELTRESTETEARVERESEALARLKQTLSAKDAEVKAGERKAHELQYDIIDDPDQLRSEVSNLRTSRLEQQRLLDSETIGCDELKRREEHCAQAARSMNQLEGEMEVASQAVARLAAATREEHDKKAKLEEKRELLASKKEGVEKKREERRAFAARHEEEKREQRQRLDALAAQATATRAECEHLRSLEGAVKKNVIEHRVKLAKLKNEKNATVAELTEYVTQRTALLEKMETKMAEKMAFLRELEAAYERGKAELADAMTTTDLDVSVTATATMQLLG